MASSEIEKETEISYLRQEILTYTPGNASPGEDERVACLYPKKLIIYMIDVITGGVSDTVLANLRSALLVDGNVGESLKEPFNEEDREIRLTDFISVIMHHHVSGEAVDQLRVKALSEVVGCFLVVIGESGVALSQFLMSDWISPISDITGRPPIILMICDLGKQHADWTRSQLRDIGIIDIYEMPYPGNLTLEEDLELLRMLQRCLVESDEGVKIRFAKTMEEMCRDPAFRRIYEQALEGSKRAKQLEKLIEEERERRYGGSEAKTWRGDTNQEEREADRSRHQEDKLAMETEWKVEREALEKRIHALTDAVKMAEQTEEKLRQEVVEVKNDSDELRIKHDDEKRALEAKLNYEEESNEEAIKQAIKDKEFTEEAMRQKLNALLTEREEEKAAHLKEKRLLKRRVKKEETRIEQLERETQKLRNKIQIESEMRSMEQQRASERSGFSSFAIRLISGSQMDLTKGIHVVDDKQGNVHLTADSTLSLGSKSPPARDEFTDILKQIADDLFDEAQIDSLGGQLGIIQGDIERAIKTNMRFHKITSDGTYEMLKEWRKGVSREGERIELRRALLAAKLVDLADRYLPQEVEEALETPDLTNKTEEKDTNIECEEDREVPKEGISKDEGRANQSYDQNEIEQLATVESNQNEDADSDVSDDVAKQEELERRALMFIQEDGNTNGLEMGKAGVNFNIGDIEGTDNPPSDAAIVTENELQLVVDKSGDGANDVIIQDIELKHGSRRETGQIGEQLDVGVKSKPFVRWSLNQTVQEAREVNESNILDDSSDQVKFSCYCCYI
ncbi:trichohyalin-like [Lytechinus variegatus]|uniref:trichohyalin-like n=1 Tax=Lytechinus variegatus TaxID=7654 RepID=UPI001BB0DA6E|nr:trichohyalin-like [Lytechinus variegatus]